MALDCTTLARVQAHLPQTDASADAVLQTFISGVSAEFERYLYRHLLSTERTEVYPLRPPARIISLRGSPVIATDGRGITLNPFEVKASASMDFSGAVAMTRNSAYVLEQDRGVLRILERLDTFTDGLLNRSSAPAYVQVRYTGGLAATTAAMITDYPDLAAACDLQVVHEFRRRTTAGAGDVRMGDSLSTHSGDYALLSGVRAVLDRLKRRRG
ncbi:MAG TPA: hypothetical protein PKW35_00660 [Nannocystaceae bacterium]|nr:hypothetical protein [Nannocystaceae bacterium]